MEYLLAVAILLGYTIIWFLWDHLNDKYKRRRAFINGLLAEERELETHYFNVLRQEEEIDTSADYLINKGLMDEKKANQVLNLYTSYRRERQSIGYQLSSLQLRRITYK